MGVNDTRDASVVDMSETRVNVLDSSDTFLLSFVGKHRSESYVSNAFNSLGRSVELRVDNDTSSVVNFYTDLLEVESLRNGSSTDSDENYIGFNLKPKFNSSQLSVSSREKARQLRERRETRERHMRRKKRGERREKGKL